MADEQDGHLSNPLVEDEGSRPYGSPVVDFADIRIAHGLPKFHAKVCKHSRLTYNRAQRRIWCSDCESSVDGFDAFMSVADHFQKMELAAQSKLQKAQEALDGTIVRRAARHLSRIWSGNQMAVSCPHCKGGLLPDDFENGGRSAWSRELELAKRAKASLPAGGANG